MNVEHESGHQHARCERMTARRRYVYVPSDRRVAVVILWSVVRVCDPHTRVPGTRRFDRAHTLTRPQTRTCDVWVWGWLWDRELRKSIIPEAFFLMYDAWCI